MIEEHYYIVAMAGSFYKLYLLNHTLKTPPTISTYEINGLLFKALEIKETCLDIIAYFHTEVIHGATKNKIL